MSIFDRLLLAIQSIGGFFAGIFALLLGTGVFGAWSITPFGDFGSYPRNIVAIVIGIVLIIVALRFCFYRLGGHRQDFVVLSGENGNIQISYETIRQLATRTGKSVRGVQEFDTRVRESQNGVVLLVKIRVLPDIDLARMGSEVQAAVKEYVEQTTGVRIERVLVHIDEVAGSSVRGPKAWVE